jgi:hypothetical protein
MLHNTPTNWLESNNRSLYQSQWDLLWSATPMLAGEPRYGPFNHRKDFGMVGRQVSADIVEAVTSMLGLVFFDVNDELAGASDGEQFVDERPLCV